MGGSASCQGGASCAANQSEKANADIRQALCRELEEARYEATLAARRYEVVAPTKRLVARELETRWNTALERVAHLEDRIAQHDAAAALRPKIDHNALIALARDLPTTWNARGTDARTKQRITHILIREVILDRDDATNEAVVVIHWNGGRHTELRVSRGRTGRYPADRHPNPVEAVQTLGGHWPDREVAATMNRMRCKPALIEVPSGSVISILPSATAWRPVNAGSSARLVSSVVGRSLTTCTGTNIACGSGRRAPRRTRLRQFHSRPRLISYRRAISAMPAPGCSVSATIRSFSAELQRRPRSPW